MNGGPGDGASVAGPTCEGGNWRLDLAYQGTAYRGWARQPGHTTVQGLVEDALATVLREPVRLSVAGRTDAGVHAWAQVASFSCARTDLVPERLRLSLNSLLPPAVAVLRVSPAAPSFVAREATSRSYRYDVWATAVKPVRERDFVWVLRGALDGAALRAAAELLAGTPRLRRPHAFRAPLSPLRARGDGGRLDGRRPDAGRRGAPLAF